jgi:hypothetical protein
VFDFRTVSLPRRQLYMTDALRSKEASDRQRAQTQAPPTFMSPAQFQEIIAAAASSGQRESTRRRRRSPSRSRTPELCDIVCHGVSWVGWPPFDLAVAHYNLDWYVCWGGRGRLKL